MQMAASEMKSITQYIGGTVRAKNDRCHLTTDCRRFEQNELKSKINSFLKRGRSEINFFKRR